MNRQRSVFSIPLVRELSAMLVVKLAALFVIAQLFFQSPEQELPAGDRFEQHLGLPSDSTSYQEKSDDQ